MAPVTPIRRTLTSQYRTAVQTVLLAILVLCLFGVICSLTTRWLHKIVLWFAPINSKYPRRPFYMQLKSNKLQVLASIAICVALLVLTPEKQSAKWVFTEVTDGSGWGSRGFSFLLGYALISKFKRIGQLTSLASFPWHGR
jgi:H+/Cl- antiporter ClcA